MGVYIIVVIAIIALFSITLCYALNKNKLLDFRILLIVAMSSVLVCITYPFIAGNFLDMIHKSEDISEAGYALIPPVLVSIGTLLLLTLLFSALSSLLISGDKANQILDIFYKSRFGSLLPLKNSGYSKLEKEEPESENKQINMLQELYEAMEIGISEPTKKISENKNDTILLYGTYPSENNFEKSVDTKQIIDTMGLENNLNMSEKYHIDSNPPEWAEAVSAGCAVNTDISDDINVVINLAFDLKQKGLYEEAILHYMYALDMNPDDELVFWIVLDICVLYKTLGQSELAKDILTNYVDKFGNTMSAAVKQEIENNL